MKLQMPSMIIRHDYSRTLSRAVMIIYWKCGSMLKDTWGNCARNPTLVLVWDEIGSSGMTCVTAAISVIHASFATVAIDTFVTNARWCEALGALPVRSVTTSKASWLWLTAFSLIGTNGRFQAWNRPF